MPSSSSSTALLGLILTLLSPTILNPVSASPEPESSPIPTAIVTAPSPSSTSSTLKIPQCAQSCLSSATLAQPCDATDTQCLCAHSAAIKSSALTCLASSSCSQSDIDTTANYYNNICVSLGYPLTALPTTSIVSATGASPTPPTYATASTSSSSSSSTTLASQSSNNANSSLKISVIVGISAGAALILALTITTCFVIYRRRRRAQEDNPDPTSDAPRKESQFSNSSTAINPISERSKTMSSSKSLSDNRKSTTSTIFTMVSLTPSDIDGSSHPNRRTNTTFNSIPYSASNYSASHYSPSRHHPSTLMSPISPILPGFPRPAEKDKDLPSEPPPGSQLSPALAAFDFGIGASRPGIGVARGSGAEAFMERSPDENSGTRAWGDGTVEKTRLFV